jgi:hypothetical protein
MDKILTKEEIEAQFVGEWILVGDPVTDETNAVLSGHVLCHSKDRDEVYREAIARRPKNFAILYTGTMPANMAIVL